MQIAFVFLVFGLGVVIEGAKFCFAGLGGALGFVCVIACSFEYAFEFENFRIAFAHVGGASIGFDLKIAFEG